VSKVSFMVLEVFDLAGRSGLLVSGRLVTGVVARGDVLRESESGALINVLGVEFPSVAHLDRVTLVVDRRDGAYLVSGRRLTGA